MKVTVRDPPRQRPPTRLGNHSQRNKRDEEITLQVCCFPHTYQHGSQQFLLLVSFGKWCKKGSYIQCNFPQPGDPAPHTVAQHCVAASKVAASSFSSA